MTDNFNTFSGVLQKDHQPFLENGSEVFYMTHLLSYGAYLPVVVSEHFFKAFAGKRVECKAFPRKTRRNIDGKRKVFSYLYCIHVKETECETDLRYVKIEGIVKELGDLDLTKDNYSIVKFELECHVSFDKPVVVSVPCRAFDSVAREMLAIRTGDEVEVTGYISGGRRSLRVIVQKVKTIENTEE